MAILWPDIEPWAFTEGFGCRTDDSPYGLIVHLSSRQAGQVWRYSLGLDKLWDDARVRHELEEAKHRLLNSVVGLLKVKPHERDWLRDKAERASRFGDASVSPHLVLPLLDDLDMLTLGKKPAPPLFPAPTMAPAP